METNELYHEIIYLDVFEQFLLRFIVGNWTEEYFENLYPIFRIKINPNVEKMGQIDFLQLIENFKIFLSQSTRKFSN